MDAIEAGDDSGGDFHRASVLARAGDQGAELLDGLLRDAGVGDAAFTQRVKALATTAPLHDLDARKSQVQAGAWGDYQMAELALHAFDLVTIAMDFDTGARPDTARRELAVRVAEQAVGRSTDEYDRVASWILESPGCSYAIQPRRSASQSATIQTPSGQARSSACWRRTHDQRSR